MKIPQITIFTIAAAMLMACSESTPSVDELVNDEDLYQKVRAECKALGSKAEQFQNEKCRNFHMAADKK